MKVLHDQLNTQSPTKNEEIASFAAYVSKLYVEYGYEVALSDILPLNRTVPDIRPEGCKRKTYLKNLPKSAIIVIFHNERLSMLLRTLYSIINRTPDELIEEIILVDDGSDWADIQLPLDEFLQKNFPPERSKVRLLRLPQRKGLMVARMTGARYASKTSEILIFLDAHFELMYNWLPPLLEPIVLNPKACTIPPFDKIAFDTLLYTKRDENLLCFYRNMNYFLRILNDDELTQPAKNFRAYVMLGCGMAIRADFFWELGGFDEGMHYWGYEHFELSFKVWMCGGELINVPCSRMGHLFRDFNTKGNTNLYGNYSFLERNLRRLIDVWLDDEHRQQVLAANPKTVTADPGDLTARFALRDSLNCRSFSWMLENVMPEMKQDSYGNGTIRSAMDAELCITSNSTNNEIVLRKCKTNDRSQFWFYSWRCEFHDVSGEMCFDAGNRKRRLNLYGCHFSRGNQKWFYDSKQKLIVNNKMCLVANSEKKIVELATCDTKNLKMKWIFDLNVESQLQECRKI